MGAVLALAAAFRFYDLQHYPPGLFSDEAANGLDVFSILDGDVQPFYPRNNGREALFFYLQALLVKLFGVGVWQLHAAAGVVGVLTVLMVFFATRVWFGRLAGVLAALLLATNHWHVTLSRTGFRAIMVPFFIAAFTAAVGFTVQAVRSGRRTQAFIYAVLAGIAFSGGFYTYISYRMMPLVVMAVAIVALLAAAHAKITLAPLKRYVPYVGVGIVAAVITVAPLVFYFAQQPETIVGRAAQVSIFNKDLQVPGGLLPTLRVVTGKTIGSFFVGSGDLNWRHNVAGYPLLNPLVGLLFLLGLVWFIHGTVMVGYRLLKGITVHLSMVYLYILFLLVAMLVPVVTTAEGIPHALRSVGLVVPIFFIAGTAGAVVLRWIARYLSSSWRAGLYGIVVGVLLLGILYDGLLYFVVARNSSAAAEAYRADLTAVAQFLKEYAAQHPEGPVPYLVLDGFSEQTVRFLTRRQTEGQAEPGRSFTVTDNDSPSLYRLVDPVASHLTVLEKGELIIFTHSSMSEADRFMQGHVGEQLQPETKRDRFGEEVMRVYRATTGEAPQTGEGDLDA